MLRTFCLISTVFLVAGCSEEPETHTLPGKEAARLVATTVSSGSFGLNTVLDQVISFTSSAPASGKITPCGDLDNIGYILENQPGEDPLFYYSFEYAYTVNCEHPDSRSSMDIGLSYTGEFDDDTTKAEYGGIGMLRLEHMAGNLISFKGNFDRAHHYQIKEDSSQNGRCTVRMTLDELIIDESDRHIQSGSAALTLDGITSRGKYSLEGILLFNGDNSATLQFDDQQFQVDMRSGALAHVQSAGEVLLARTK